MITLTQSPLRYSPAGNPVRFTLSSNLNNVLLFKIIVYTGNTSTYIGNVVYTGNIYPTPVTPGVANINLTKQLSSLVKYDADNRSTNIYEGKSKPLASYYFTATEYGVSNGLLVALGTTFTSDTFNVYDGNLDISNFTNLLTNSSHVITAGQQAKFLSLSPNFKSVSINSVEQLYLNTANTVGLQAKYVVNGTSYLFPIVKLAQAVITPNSATAAVAAKSNITVNTSASANDNISILDASNNTLATYTATASTTATAIAAGLTTSFNSFNYGYGASYSNTTITLSAPASYGASGNNIVLHTILPTATTTTTTSGTASTPAIAFLSSIPTASAGQTIRIRVNDASLGYIELSFQTADGNQETLLSNIINDINNKTSYGYTAIRYSSNSIRITAKAGSGTTQNGYVCIYSINGSDTLTTGFGNGTAAVAGTTTTTNNNIINVTIPAFSGGVDGTAASSSTTYTYPALPPLIRLNVAPVALLNNGITYQLQDGDKYSVVILDVNNLEVTETRTYIFKPNICTVEAVNVLWINQFGAVDSVQMVAPQLSVSTSKLSIQKNNINLNSSSIYTTNNVFNVANETYNTTSKSTLKMYTKPLSDSESNYLSDMIGTRQAYISLINGQLVPVQIVNKNYSVQRKKYVSDGLIQTQFEFDFDDNHTPSLSTISMITN